MTEPLPSDPQRVTPGHFGLDFSDVKPPEQAIPVIGNPPEGYVLKYDDTGKSLWYAQEVLPSDPPQLRLLIQDPVTHHLSSAGVYSMKDGSRLGDDNPKYPLGSGKLRFSTDKNPDQIPIKVKTNQLGQQVSVGPDNPLVDWGYQISTPTRSDEILSKVDQGIDQLQTPLSSYTQTKLATLGGKVSNLKSISSSCTEAVQQQLLNRLGTLASVADDASSQCLSAITERASTLGISPADLLIAASTGEGYVVRNPTVNASGNIVSQPAAPIQPIIPGVNASPIVGQPPIAPLNQAQQIADAAAFFAPGFQLPFGTQMMNPQGWVHPVVCEINPTVQPGMCRNAINTTTGGWEQVTDANGANPVKGFHCVPPSMPNVPCAQAPFMLPGFAGALGNQAVVVFPPGMPQQPRQGVGLGGQQGGPAAPLPQQGPAPQPGGAAPGGAGPQPPAPQPGGGAQQNQPQQPQPQQPQPQGNQPQGNQQNQGGLQPVIPPVGMGTGSCPPGTHFVQSPAQFGIEVGSGCAPDTNTPPISQGASQTPGSGLASADFKGLELCTDFVTQIYDTQNPADLDLSKLVGRPEVLTRSAGLSDFYTSPLKTIQSWIVSATVDTFNVLFLIARPIIEASSSFGCSDKRLQPILAVKALYGFCRQWLGYQSNSTETALDQGENFVCPNKLPTPDNAGTALLAGTIDRKTYECWVKAGGIKPEIWDKVVDANRARLSVTDLTTLFKRKKITEEEYTNRIKELGYNRDKITDSLLALYEQIPGVADLIRMMMRDVADTDIVNEFRLDDLFTQKWQGPLKEYGESQGITEEIARFYWLAHWTYPSPTQAYEMLHRLRHLPENGGSEQFTKLIRDVLITQDILPFWVDKLMQISYHPITRVDTRRLYNAGVLDDEQVKNAIRAQGYDDDNVEHLFEFMKDDKRRVFQKRPYIKQWAMGLLTDMQLYEMMNNDNIPMDIRQDLKEWAQMTVEIEANKVCIQQAKRRFMKGEIAQDDLVGVLQGYGIEATQAQRVAGNWRCLQSSRSKTQTLGQLCTSYQQGIITLAQFQDRMVNLGYSPMDALELIGQCQFKLDQRQRKEAEAKAIKDQKLQDKFNKESEKAAAKALQNATKAERALQAARKATIARDKLVIAAANELHKRAGYDLGEILIQAKKAIRDVQQVKGVTLDEAIQMAVVGMESIEAGTILDVYSAASSATLPVVQVEE